MDSRNGQGEVPRLNAIELTNAEVQYLFGIVMAEYNATAENASVAEKLTEVLKTWRKQ